MGFWAAAAPAIISGVAGFLGSRSQAKAAEAAARAAQQPTRQWTDPRYGSDIDAILQASRDLYAQGLPSRPVPQGSGTSANTRAALEALRGRAMGTDPTVAAGQDYIQRGLSDPYGGNVLTRGLAESLMGGGGGDYGWANDALRSFTSQDPLNGYTPGAGYQRPVSGYTPGVGYDARERYDPASGGWANAPGGTTRSGASAVSMPAGSYPVGYTPSAGGPVRPPGQSPGGRPGEGGTPQQGGLSTGLWDRYAEDYLNLDNTSQVDALIESMRPSWDRSVQSALADVEARAEGVGRMGSDAWSDARAEATQRALEQWGQTEAGTRLSDLQNRQQIGAGVLGMANTRDISGAQIKSNEQIAAENRAAAASAAAAANAAAARNASLQYELGMRGLDVQEMLGTRGLDLQEATDFRGQNLQGLLGALSAGQGNNQLLAGLAGNLDASQLGMLGAIPGINDASYAGLDRYLPLSMQADRNRASAANARALAEWQNAMLPQENLDLYSNRIFQLADRYDTRYGQQPAAPYTGPPPNTAGLLGALGGFFQGGGAGLFGGGGGGGGSTATPPFNPYVPDPYTGRALV